VAEGPIRRLLKRVGNRTRRQLLRERTEQQKGIRRLRVDSEHGLRAEPGDRHRIVEALHRFAARQDDPRFYRVRDVARRIAGVGSLGVERYVVLVEGRQPGRNALLDLKAARPSALQRYLPEQPAWKDEAERTVTVQQWLQAAPPPRLAALQVVRRPFVLRELQPSDDRLDLQHWEAGEIGLANTLRTMGALTAWAHLRSGGRRGSAVMDEWMDFGRRREWQRPLLALAEEAARRLLVDWKTYCEAYDAGAVDDHG
jgi:uncharacterized protein (DUF2252 family)